jgi:hypothetical protein
MNVVQMLVTCVRDKDSGFPSIEDSCCWDMASHPPLHVTQS